MTWRVRQRNRTSGSPGPNQFRTLSLLHSDHGCQPRRSSEPSRQASQGTFRHGQSSPSPRPSCFPSRDPLFPLRLVSAGLGEWPWRARHPRHHQPHPAAGPTSSPRPRPRLPATTERGSCRRGRHPRICCEFHRPRTENPCRGFPSSSPWSRRAPGPGHRARELHGIVGDFMSSSENAGLTRCALQDFKSAATGVSAKAMRNELNSMIQKIDDPEYKKVRVSSCWR